MCQGGIKKIGRPKTAYQNGPGPIRTGDLLLRRQPLYPSELLGHTAFSALSKQDIIVKRRFCQRRIVRDVSRSRRIARATCRERKVQRAGWLRSAGPKVDRAFTKRIF